MMCSMCNKQATIFCMGKFISFSVCFDHADEYAAWLTAENGLEPRPETEIHLTPAPTGFVKCYMCNLRATIFCMGKFDTVNVCLDHADEHAAWLTAENGLEPREECAYAAGCKNAARIFHGTEWGVFWVCFDHADNYGFYVMSRLGLKARPKREPFTVHVTCEDADREYQYTSIVDALEYMANVGAYAEFSGRPGHYDITLTTVDSHGQRLQLWPL